MIQPMRSPRPAARRPGGFTLVELLVTVTIIAILASIALVALSSARTTAKIAKTKATITKLHTLITRQYDSYLTRRVTVDYTNVPPGGVPAVAMAAGRLRALRELMRMEMPDRFSDITNPDSVDPDANPPSASAESSPLQFDIALPDEVAKATGQSYVTARVYRSPLARAFFRRYVYAPPSATYGSAEMLYLIVTHLGKDARSQFNDSEVGDADGDGWPEFRDAWGNPIYFLRWAPAFNDSQIQPNVVSPSALSASLTSTQLADLWNTNSHVQDVVKQVSENDHDPFDPRGVYAFARVPPSCPPAGPRPTVMYAWRLVPLIVSAGPDGIYDLSFSWEDKDLTSPYNNYFFDGDPYERCIGLPVDTDNMSVTAPGKKNGQLNHYDNIHNHRLQD